MIKWRNQETAFEPKPLAEFLARLSELAAAQVQARLTQAPLVVVAEAARCRVMQHLAASRYEQGGLLVGEVFGRDGAHMATEVMLVHIVLAVASVDYTSSGVALRMESDVWERARPTLADGRTVVGWYHSHPGLGAFFSDTDRRTQRAFFPHPYSLGWVVDPLQGEEEWFLGAQAVELALARVLTDPCG
jgi:proteasome lid subunit RPN8/RPN11